MADEFYDDPLPRPYGLTSHHLARAKFNRQTVNCLSHSLQACQADNDETEYQRISKVPCGHRLTDAKLECKSPLCTLFSLCAEKNVSWTIGNYQIVQYNLPLILLLNRTFPGKKSRKFIAAAKHFGMVFALLRKYGVAKLAADNIVSFLAISDQAFTGALFTAFAKQPRVPNEFRELLIAAKDADYEFSLNLCLPIGTNVPLATFFQPQNVLLGGTSNCRISLALTRQIIEQQGDNECNLATRTESGCEYKTLDYVQVNCSAVRLNDSEFYAKLPFSFPGIALLAYFDICPNIDTVELCFHQRFVNSCVVEKCFINDGDIAERGRAYKLVYRVADCQIPGIENWLILPIDRSMSLSDALHKSKFEPFCDFVDLTPIDATTLRFKSSLGKRIEMPHDNIMLSWRHFNILRFQNGVCGKLFC